MTSTNLPKRISTALINALGSGVVPRVGLERIAVGRERELLSLLHDLENTAEGGSAFRFIIGRYGAGKSFLLQLIRNRAMEQGFVVADADFSPERKLAGTGGSSLGVYRELMGNLATKIRPDGGALAPILERWIAGIQTQVARESGCGPSDPGFDDQVEDKIRSVVKEIEDLVNGFDFANVIIAYWYGYRNDDDAKKEGALRWLRGEFATKGEARAALGVRVIIDDDSWYDYVKLLARFVADIGYKGLLIILDEAVHLYKITHAQSRQNNYDKLLAIFNDTMQGRVGYLDVLIGGTPQFLEDSRRGLYSDPAWQRRTVTSRIVKSALQSLTGPVIRLEPLNPDELLRLLEQITTVHSDHYNTPHSLKKPDLQIFLTEMTRRLGSDILLTPGEVVRDWLVVLNVLHQNPQLSISSVMLGEQFQVNGFHLNNQDGSLQPPKIPNEYAEFTL
ncbi:MAG: ATP-binding protein [Synechococcales cyanobacterium]|nr:DUF2791 family P-loop domain-containing protein [Cyanobacteria bacterium REEB444]